MSLLVAAACCAAALGEEVATSGSGSAVVAQPAKAEAVASPGPMVKKHRETPMLPGTQWHVNDMKRPAPPVVTPGTFPSADAAGKPPSDAIVLFDGGDLSQWQSCKGGGPAPWPVVDGAMVTKETDIETKQKFGDLQVHVEYAEPTPATGASQGRGNSGVFLMGKFEVQVLDNYGNPTYPDGMAGAVYAQTPPMANACKPRENGRLMTSPSPRRGWMRKGMWPRPGM